jgi:hypothetical protein
MLLKSDRMHRRKRPDAASFESGRDKIYAESSLSTNFMTKRVGSSVTERAPASGPCPSSLRAPAKLMSRYVNADLTRPLLVHITVHLVHHFQPPASRHVTADLVSHGRSLLFVENLLSFAEIEPAILGLN